MMSDIIIEPTILPREEELTGTCLFCLTPYETGILKRSFTPEATTRLALFHSNLYRITDKDSTFYWAGPAIGAPMAVMTIEKLIARGLRRYIVVGWCGSLTEKVRVPDLVIPTWGRSEEGTSRHYLGGRTTHLPGDSGGKIAEHLAGEGFTVHQGPVWTTDALYRESWGKARKYKSIGIIGVDMEFTALARLAAFRGIEMAVVLIVSDEIREGRNRQSFQGKQFKKQSKSLLNSLCVLMKDSFHF